MSIHFQRRAHASHTATRPWRNLLRLGDVANEAAQHYGKPLGGVRVLALEQMAAMPFATQLLARLGADVVKVEHPVQGESGRGSSPSITDPEGRVVGATFLRSNLGKRSIGIDIRSEQGRALVLRLAPRFDVFAENFKAGTLDRLGLGYAAVDAVHPRVIYASVSGFGADASGYGDWPAYASIVEAMSGIYDFMRRPDERPRPNPVGALGDISTALFSVIGILAALRHRDHTGLGQRVDLAMYDATVAMTDIVTNFYSLGWERQASPAPFLIASFKAKDGWFVMQMVREHQFANLADLLGKPEWKDDPRFAERTGWDIHLDDVIRPAIESWAAGMTKLEAAAKLSAAGLAVGPAHEAAEVVADEHLVQRNMLVEMPRPNDDGPPVLVPGNPVKLSRVAEGPETRVPWVGEHTTQVLRDELQCSDDELDTLRRNGVISGPSVT
jgi:crotonobetainyl-CoA:carnitine CoA-transferase CaiB-like acyl-CoA transferase